VSIAMAVGRTEGMVRMGRMGIGDGRQSGLLSFALPVGGCVWASAGAASYRPGGRDQRVAGMGDLPTSMGYGPPWSAFLASGGGGPGGGRPGLRHPASGGAGAGGTDVGRWLSTHCHHTAAIGPRRAFHAVGSLCPDFQLHLSFRVPQRGGGLGMADGVVCFPGGLVGRADPQRVGHSEPLSSGGPTGRRIPLGRGCGSPPAGVALAHANVLR
jgi:hypothetical protein